MEPNRGGCGLSNPKESSDLDTKLEVTKSSEVDLVRRAQAGDSAAFGSLVRSHQRRAVSVAYRLLGNSADASDVSQEAFVRAYRNLGQLDDPARFGGWLMRVVSNLALNFRRSRAARPATSLDAALEVGAEIRRPTTGLKAAGAHEGDDHRAGELNDAVSRAMEQLPDKQRLALILFSVEGMPQKEVADILECSVELVKWNVFQARKKLRELLQEFL